MAVVDREIWFYLLLLVVALAAGSAMFPFTMAVLFPPPRPSRTQASLETVRAALLALDDGSRPYRLVAGPDDTLRLDWQAVDASWCEPFARVKLTIIYQARLLLRPAEHALRCHEVLRSSDFFIGFDGWRPRFNFNLTYKAGMLNVLWTGLAYGIQPGFPPRIGQVYRYTLDTVRAKRDLKCVLEAHGWSFRPAIWGWEVDPRRADFGDRFLPGPLRAWPRVRLWGMIYVSLWLALIALLYFGLPPSLAKTIFLVAFPGAWWSIQVLFIVVWRLIERTSARRRDLAG